MATLEERERKGAMNQALLREVNERVVEQATRAMANRQKPMDLICECFDRDCARRQASRGTRFSRKSRSTPTVRPPPGAG